MQRSFKNKLLGYEAAPPPGAWEHISEQLDRELIPADARLSAKIEHSSLTPPRNLWREIESFLDNETTPARQGKVIPLLLRRLSVAVILAAAVAVSTMYIFDWRHNDQAPELSASLKRNFNIKTDESRILPVPSPAREIAIEPVHAARPLIETIPAVYAPPSDFISNEQPEQPNEISEAFISDIQPVNAEQPVNIPARPIRDAGGNIIMDLSLISKPNDPYITVTGPNGSQTRISNKFVNCLSYLNGDISNDGTDNDGIMWKDKFQSWRDKLLHEDSFIPAASNFFDIFEMKEMIQE